MQRCREGCRRNYDLLLKGGRVICPASEIAASYDVAIRDGRIARGTQHRSSGFHRCPPCLRQARVAGSMSTPVLTSTNKSRANSSLDPDMVGVRSGVTTVVDQGSPSCMTLPGFRRFIVEKSATRVLAFLSAYLVGGLEGHFYPDLYSPTAVNIEATVTSALANKDLIRGIKGRAGIDSFARWASRSWRWRRRSAIARIFPSTFISGRSGDCRRAERTANTPIQSSNGSFRSFVEVMCLPIRLRDIPAGSLTREEMSIR